MRSRQAGFSLKTTGPMAKLILSCLLVARLVGVVVVGLVAEEMDWVRWSSQEMVRGTVSLMRSSVSEQCGKKPDDSSSFMNTSSSNDGLVVVRNSQVLVSPSFMAKEKNRKHVAFLTSMIEAGYSIPNVAYRFSANSTGACEDDCCLVIAKRDKGQPGIMVPNPYFHDLEFWTAVRRILKQTASERPWSGRRDSVFWRGHIQVSPCADEQGNWHRLRAATINSPKIDVRCWMLKKCRIRDDRTSPCPGLEYDDAMKRARDNPSLITREGHVPKENFTNYRYLLNLPGSTQGSYSRNLNHLWFLDSVLLLWKSSHAEWYYPDLEHKKTHLDVDYETILTLLEDAGLDTDQLRRGARLVDRHLLCPSCLANYFMTLFDALPYNKDLLCSLECSHLLHVLPTNRHLSKFDLLHRRRLSTTIPTVPVDQNEMCDPQTRLLKC